MTSFFGDIRTVAGRPATVTTLTDRTWLTMSTGDRVRRVLPSLAETCPGRDVACHVVGEPLTVSWGSGPHFVGASRGALPRRYRYQRWLFSLPLQDAAPARRRGPFLAGSNISTLGWVEGAVEKVPADLDAAAGSGASTVRRTPEHPDTLSAGSRR